MQVNAAWDLLNIFRRIHLVSLDIKWLIIFFTIYWQRVKREKLLYFMFWTFQHGINLETPSYDTSLQIKAIGEIINIVFLAFLSEAVAWSRPVKVSLKFSQNLLENIFVGFSFLIKLHVSGFYKKRFKHMCFSVNLKKFLRHFWLFSFIGRYPWLKFQLHPIKRVEVSRALHRYFWFSYKCDVYKNISPNEGLMFLHPNIRAYLLCSIYW